MKVETPKRLISAKKRTVRPKNLPLKLASSTQADMSPSKTSRQEILRQKIEALLELAKLAPVQAEGLKARSTHGLISSDIPVVNEASPIPPDSEALEQSVDYLLSLIKSRIDVTRS
jgi:hypothetical protein